jgi:hypothetical protein
MGLFSKKAAAAEAAPVDAEAPAVVPAVVVPEPEPAAVEAAPAASKKSGFSLFGSGKDKTEEPLTTAPSASKMSHSE